MHVVYRFGVGGLENGIVNLINGLPADEFRHSVVALTSCDAAFCRRVTRPDVQFIGLQKPPGHGWRVFRSIARLFREQRPAIVHTRNLAALEMQLPAWFARVPVRVHGEHGRDMSDPDGVDRRYRLVRYMLAPFVTHFVAVSEDLERYLVDAIGIDAYRVSRISNGVDNVKFSPAIAAGSPMSRVRPLVVGTVGRLDQIKGQDNLVEAVACLLRDSPSRRETLRVVLCGDGPARESLRAAIESRGLQDVVELLGERADVADVMRTLDLFVLPSRGEGMSNTILEAMACGLPVVATAVGGNPEIVQEGKTGYLVPPADPAELASAIARYLDDGHLRHVHGQRGRAEVERSFSLPGMVQRYATLYREALSGRR
jgi:sugar transferase (PEP-CTERM/EpsH1 system associated)